MNQIKFYTDTKTWHTEDGFRVLPLFDAVGNVWLYETKLYGLHAGGRWTAYKTGFPQIERVDGERIGFRMELDPVDAITDVDSVQKELMSCAARLQVQEQARELKKIDDAPHFERIAALSRMWLKKGNSK